MNLEARLDEVRAEYLSRMTRGSGRLLHEVEQYVSARSGKMLRPRMTLLAAATLGEEVFMSRRTLLLATAVEMLHNASLIHDDVVDGDTQRRGLPSVWSKWSSQVAVLVGDYLLAQVMHLVNEVDDSSVARLINHTVEAMVESELLQLELRAHTDHTQDFQRSTYLKIIDGKTARLFATAAAFGNPEYEEFGLHYGRLFQLRDDMADGEATEFTLDLVTHEEKFLESLPQLAINV